MKFDLEQGARREETLLGKIVFYLISMTVILGNIFTIITGVS